MQSVDVLIIITIRILSFKCSVLITITIRRCTLSYCFVKCGCSYHYNDKYLALEILFVFQFQSRRFAKCRSTLTWGGQRYRLYMHFVQRCIFYMWFVQRCRYQCIFCNVVDTQCIFCNLFCWLAQSLAWLQTFQN